MIFTIQKQISKRLILEDIKAIAFLIEQLSAKITQNEEVKPYFQKVELSQEEIGDNLMSHSHLIRNLQSPLIDRNARVNLKSVDHLLDYLKKWFAEYKLNEEGYKPVQKTIKAIELEGKLRCLKEFIGPALTYEDDIAAFPLGFHPSYQKVYQRIQVVESSNTEKTRKNYKLFKEMMIITNASVLTQLRQSNSVLGVMSFGLSYPRFFLDSKGAELRNVAFLRQPSLGTLLSIWNLPEKGAISHLKYVEYPRIKTNRLIYIPLDETQYQQADIFTPSEGKVPVRVIFNREITFWNERQNCLACSSFKSIDYYSNVIIHAHGGGFVALSSQTMQSYTRLWSKELDVPVFSIDYSKPPHCTFPSPVHEVFAVYKFITTQLHRHCNIQADQIVMAGDSAGSNLVLSAYALAMKAQLPPAKGFFLAYPASDLRSAYTPSRISAFSDAILHPSLLLLCLREYLGSNHKQAENHPLASPLLLSQAFIGGDLTDGRWPLKWPPTRMIVGELDPLLDDSVRLCARMVNSQIDVQLKIYKQLGHGFMSVENIIQQGKRGIVDSIHLIRELFLSK